MKTRAKSTVKAVSLIMAILVIMPIENADTKELIIRSVIAAALVLVFVALVVTDAIREERSWRNLDAQILRNKDKEINSRYSTNYLKHSNSQRNTEMFKASNTNMKTVSNGLWLTVKNTSKELYPSQDIQVLKW